MREISESSLLSTSFSLPEAGDGVIGASGNLNLREISGTLPDPVQSRKPFRSSTSVIVSIDRTQPAPQKIVRIGRVVPPPA